MHILYLDQHFATRTGTSGGRSHEFSRILVERGHKVTMVTGAYDLGGLNLTSERLVERTQVDGIEIRVIRVPYGQKMSVPSRIWSFLRFMFLAGVVGARVKGIDVVFATSTPLTIAVPGMFISAVRRRPFVFEVRDLWPKVPIAMGILRNPILKAVARLLEKTAYRRARRIVALSPGMKEGIVVSGVKPEKITVIPNSSDVELFRVPAVNGAALRVQNPAWGDGPLLVYAGAFGKVNGLEYVVELAQKAKPLDPGIRFVLAGNGSEKNRVTDLARSLGVLDQNLFIIDAMPRFELAALLSASTVLSSFVTPIKALEANSANKFFDAFAAGKPVVINHGGWQAELLSQSGAGIVLDPRDPGKSAAELIKALRDEQWLKQAGEASRYLGDEVYDRRKLSLQLEEVFQEAVNAR